MNSDTAPIAIVVDDNAIILMAACQILEDAGFRTLEAGNADQALKLLTEHDGQVTLLFTDVEMPGTINGFELAHHVARRWADVSVLVASGRRTPASGEMPEQAIFIGKPFSAEVVHERLQQLLPEDAKPAPLRSS